MTIGYRMRHDESTDREVGRAVIATQLGQRPSEQAGNVHLGDEELGADLSLGLLLHEPQSEEVPFPVGQGPTRSRIRARSSTCSRSASITPRMSISAGSSSASAASRDPLWYELRAAIASTTSSRESSRRAASSVAVGARPRSWAMSAVAAFTAT